MSSGGRRGGRPLSGTDEDRGGFGAHGQHVLVAQDLKLLAQCGIHRTLGQVTVQHAQKPGQGTGTEVEGEDMCE